MCFHWYSQKIYYLPKSVDIASVQSNIFEAFREFSPHDLSSAIGLYNDTPADMVEKHVPKK